MPYIAPRTYYSKKVVVKPKVHWSLYKRLGECTVTNPTTGGIQMAYGQFTLVSANTDTNYQPGITKKIKHLKVEVTRPRAKDFEKVAPTVMKSKIYLLYLPQGVTFSTTKGEQTVSAYLSETIINHPEWIMAERNLSTKMLNDSNQLAVTQTINCKLSRNLRSGDQIVAIIANLYDTNGFNGSPTAVALNYKIEYSFAACI